MAVSNAGGILSIPPSSCLLLLRLAGRTVGSAAVSVDIDLTRSEFSITWRLGSLWSTAVRGRRADIAEIGVVVEGVRLLVERVTLSAVNGVVMSNGCRSRFIHPGIGHPRLRALHAMFSFAPLIRPPAFGLPSNHLAQIQNGEPMESLQLVEGVKEHRFGGGLKPVERRWLSAVMASFLGLPSSYVQKTRKAPVPSYDSSDDESDWQ